MAARFLPNCSARLAIAWRSPPLTSSTLLKGRLAGQFFTNAANKHQTLKTYGNTILDIARPRRWSSREFFMPGRDPGGIFVTILLGIVGAFLGGFLGTFIGLGKITSFDLGGIFIATIGSILVLIIYRMVTKNRT